MGQANQRFAHRGVLGAPGHLADRVLDPQRGVGPVTGQLIQTQLSADHIPTAGHGQLFAVRAEGQVKDGQAARGQPDQLGTLAVPPADDAVVAAGHKGSAVGSEPDRADVVRMPQRLAESLTSRHVPELSCLVPAAGEQPRTIRGIRQTLDRTTVVQRTRHLLPGGQVPQMHSPRNGNVPLSRADRQRLAVRTELQGKQDEAFVLEHVANQFPASGVPEPNGPIHTTRRELLAIRGECDGPDRPRMGQRRADRLAGLDVPALDLEKHIVRQGQHLPVRAHGQRPIGPDRQG